MIKTLPQNIEAEKAVLGSIILRPKAYIEVSPIINKESFYDLKNSKIFEVISELHKSNTPIDLLSLSKNIDGVSISELIDITNSVPASTNAKYYATEIAKEKRMRDIIEMGSKIIEVGYKDDYDNVPVILSQLQKDLVSKTYKEENISEVIIEFDKKTAEYQDKKAKGIDLLGMSFGYSKLDKVIDGLREGHLIIIGGYTNLGKSSMALNIVANLIKENKRVIYYSLEMTQVDTLTRLLGIMTEDNGRSIIKGYAKDIEKVNEAKQKIINSGFMVKTGLSELSEIMMSMYEENLKQNVDCFVVDYIQNVKVKGAKSEYETTTTTSVELQLNAQRLNIPIIALSQVSNDGAKNKDSQLVMSFKGSGAIGASADLAIEIKTSESSNEERIAKMQRGEPVNMKWIIEKNRHGSVGFIEVTFNGHTGVFEESLYEQL